jgi:hypothetical protein
MVTDPLGVDVPEPATLIVTATVSVSLIVALAGVTVTVGVVFVVPPPPPPLLPPPPPHPTVKKLAARTTSIVQKMFRFRFDQPGRKKSTSDANATPPAALNQPVRFDASLTAPVGAAVVLTVTCPEALVVTPVSVTADWPAVGAHAGASTAPEGEDVSAHVSVTVPVYPFVLATVIFDVALPPAVIAAGADADKVKLTSVTVTDVVPVLAA